VTRYRRPAPYEELDHTADAGVVVRAKSADEALARLVLAFADLVTGGAPVSPTSELVIEIEPADRAAMAIDVLRELLFRFETERKIPDAVEVRRFDPAKGAELCVELGPYDPERHGDGLDLKAVTFHAARFESDGAGWVAQIVFDI
jgi:SHS2 domain-containing protein